MTDWLVAPPGTRPNEAGWRKPWPGLRLSWNINGERPPLAVQRDGVLVSTGVPLLAEGAESECSHCAEPITLPGGSWTTGDGTTACTDTSAPYVPHRPKEG
jgi:hypothetical protein